VSLRILPGADLSQWWENDWYNVGFPSGPNVLLLHSTETPSWPWYRGGADAPNITIKPKARQFRQHFAANRSSRALANLPGGVDTNFANVFQVEIIAYSDRRIAQSIGRDDLWVGNLTDGDLRYIAKVLAPLVKAYPIPFKLSPRWTRNPRYGTGAPQRMTFAEWRSFRGWTYHASAPENSHWDTGALNIPRIMKFTEDLVGEGDWFDMASKADLRDVVGEVVAEYLTDPGHNSPLGVLLRRTELMYLRQRDEMRDTLRSIERKVDALVEDDGQGEVPEPATARELFAQAGFEGDDLDVALAVAYLESGGYVDAVGDLHMVGKPVDQNDPSKGTWGPSVGLFQYLTMSDPPAGGYEPDTLRDIELLRDPLEQAKAAKVLVDARGWGQWTMHPDSGKRDNYSDYHVRVGVDFPLLAGHERAGCWSLDGCPEGA